MNTEKKTSEELLQELKDSMTAKEWHRFCNRYAGRNQDAVVWHIRRINGGSIPRSLPSKLKQIIEEGRVSL
jgi:hypothetical protein